MSQLWPSLSNPVTPGRRTHPATHCTVLTTTCVLCVPAPARFRRPNQPLLKAPFVPNARTWPRQSPPPPPLATLAAGWTWSTRCVRTGACCPPVRPSPPPHCTPPSPPRSLPPLPQLGGNLWKRDTAGTKWDERYIGALPGRVQARAAPSPPAPPPPPHPTPPHPTPQSSRTGSCCTTRSRSSR